MPSYSRELTVLGLLAATVWLPQCSILTKVDWSTIPPAGGASSGGAAGSIGEAGATPSAGEGGLAGEGGTAGESGAGGEGGSAGESEVGGGFGGSLSGGAGTAGKGGSGGTTANGGSDDGGAGGPVHTTCSTAPPTPAVVPDLSPFIILFDGGPGMNGDRGGRVGLDNTCRQAKTKLNLPQSDARAVISVQAVRPTDPKDETADQIVNMAGKYHIPADAPEVRSPLGIPFAPSWHQMWKIMGDLPSLVCTGVMPPDVRLWLTGSSGKSASFEVIENQAGPPYFGLLDASNDMNSVQFANACDGWTTGTASAATKAHVGSTWASYDRVDDGHPRFIDLRLVECNAATANVLCVAFDPIP